MRLLMDGDALALLSGGEMGVGALAGAWGFDSYVPPRIGSYLWPELDGRGVEGATLIWDRFGLL
jgi:hypothetical protein